MTPLWFVFGTIALTIGQAKANCNVRQSDLQAKHPLLLDDNAYTDVRRFKRVDASNYVNMVAGENVTLVCPGLYNYMSGGNSKPVEIITASCVSGYNFRVDEQTIALNKIACFSESYFDIRVGTPNSCGLNRVFIEVGYNIPGSLEFFLKQYELCFDQSTLTPVTSQHWVLNGYRASKSGTTSAYLFRQADPAEAYLRKTQTLSFTEQLDINSANKYITTTNYLEAKPMVPRTDFVFGNQQLSTDYYFNTIPIWKTFTSTYLSTLEASIRTLTNTDGDLRVYSTVIGIAELPNNNGELKPIYLHASNDERYIPLPAYISKSVINYENEQVVFLIIAHRGEVARSTAAEGVCAEDVCAQLRWLPWRHVPPSERPFVTCCRADDALLRRRLPRALPPDAARTSSSAPGLLVGRALSYD